MDKIDQAIEYVRDELECYQLPGSYMDSEYYIRCAAKAEVLGDVLYRLQQIKEEK